MGKERATQSLPGSIDVPLREPHIKPHEGMRLGRYELLHPIAQGGMAEVWIARFVGELGLTRIVALKTIRPDHFGNPAFRHAFFDEARIAARLSHANVVPVLDLGEQGDILFQVMMLIEGGSVSALLRGHRERMGAPNEDVGLPIPIALRICSDALSGLQAAHELTDDKGGPLELVHRDVSPQNILVGIDGVARVADFGVAKALGRLVEVTQVGQVRGKPGYLAPEQLDRRPLDRRTDVFSSGIVLWEMLTGRKLFNDSILPSPAQLGEEKIRDPRSVREEIPEAVAEVALRALRFEPKDRFQSAEEMNRALEIAGGGFISSPRVAQFVAATCGLRIAQLRQRIRGEDGAPVTSVMPAYDWNDQRTSLAHGDGQPRRRPLLVVGAVGAAMLLGMIVARAFNPDPSPRIEAPVPHEALEAAPTPEGDADEIVAPPAEAESDPSGGLERSLASTSTAQIRASGRAQRALPAKASAPPKHHLRPKFGNPYR